MVVFTCNHCGDSLQKPTVEKHYFTKCRREKSLTCIDCLKDFFGDEFVSHSKCFTEEERYAAKGTFVNGIVKKGELKQEKWTDMIRNILNTESNLSFSCRKALQIIVNYDNIPRKKPKFMNFMKNVARGHQNCFEEVWNIIEKYKSENVANSNTNNTTTDLNNDIKINGKISKENDNLKKKNKHKDDEIDSTENNPIKTDENVSENLSKTKKSKKKSKNQNTEDDVALETDFKPIGNHKEESIPEFKDDCNTFAKQKKKRKNLKNQINEHNNIDKENNVNLNDNITTENEEKISIKRKVKTDLVSSKSKKSKLDKTCTVVEEKNLDSALPNESFDLKSEILKVVNKKGTITVDALEKKVLKKYKKAGGLDCDKIQKKIIKKVKKLQNIVIENNVIKTI